MTYKYYRSYKIILVFINSGYTQKSMTVASGLTTLPVKLHMITKGNKHLGASMENEKSRIKKV